MDVFWNKVELNFNVLFSVFDFWIKDEKIRKLWKHGCESEKESGKYEENKEENKNRKGERIKS